MVSQIIQLAIYAAVFVFVAWGALWLCERTKMPQWVIWIVGAILLIVLLLFIAGQFSSGGQSFRLFPHGN